MIVAAILARLRTMERSAAEALLVGLGVARDRLRVEVGERLFGSRGVC